MKDLIALVGDPWAITDDGFAAVVGGIESLSAGDVKIDPAALSAEPDQPLRGTVTANVRDGVGIIPVRGPLFARSNWITRILGFSSYDLIARDFRAAMQNPDVKAIVLDVDSPGGMVTGTAELSALIFGARGQGKPIIAFAGGMMASAAYWIGSAADRIVAAETALLGSIGVRMDVVDTSERDARSGVKKRTIVSRQSPFKAEDMESDEGRERVQTVVDGLAAVFIDAVARHRGVTADAVVAGYGKGDVLVARDAKAAGMVRGDSEYQDRHTYPTREAAEAAGKAKLAEFARGTVTFSGSMPGRPDLFAESRISLSGFRAGVDGGFALKKVEHSFSNTGYATNVEAETVA